MKTFLFLLFGALVTAGLIGGGIFLFRHLEQKRKVQYPYPECKICMQWFQEHAGEPDSIQPLGWKRWISSEDSEVVVIEGRFRGKNQYGGWQVDVRRWKIKNKEIISTERQEE